MKSKLITLLLSILFSNTSFCQDWSTQAEIYDFEVGDIFHFDIQAYSYSGGGAMYQTQNIEIIEKTYIGSDTLEYKKFVKSLMNTQYGSHYEEDTTTHRYANLNVLIIKDTVYYSSSYNGRKITSSSYSNPPYQWGGSKYVDGCGRAYYEYVHLQDFERTENLVYYKKGNEEWGTPNVITRLKEHDEDSKSITIYPNPANSFIRIKAVEEIVEIRVFNQVGLQVKHLRGNYDYISVSDLPQGLYILAVYGDGWQANRKVVVY